jgi:DNA topoisomerase IA
MEGIVVMTMKTQENESMLPQLAVGQGFAAERVAVPTERFTRPAHANNTEASLVKKLEELGIGPTIYI